MEMERGTEREGEYGAEGEQKGRKETGWLAARKKVTVILLQGK